MACGFGCADQFINELKQDPGIRIQDLGSSSRLLTPKSYLLAPNSYLLTPASCPLTPVLQYYEIRIDGEFVWRQSRFHLNFKW